MKKDIVMTIDEKAKAYDEALERARKIHNEILNNEILGFPDQIREIFPQLRESEDERIINQLITLVNSTGEVLLIPTNKEELVAWLNKCKESLHISETCKENADSFTDEDKRIKETIKKCLIHDCSLSWKETQNCLAWLEKQEDASKAIEAVDRIDKYIDEHLANAHDMKDSNPDKKYYRGWDDALGKMAGILQNVYSGEKQKEQKPEERFEEAREKYQVEWSEEDEKLFWGFMAWVPNEELERLGITRDDILKKLKSLRSHPIQSKEAYREGFQTARHATALAFMNYCDKIRPNGKMCLSNGECEEIEKAFLIGDWEKIERYFHKYQWKPSKEQINALNAFNCHGELSYVGQQSQLISLYNDLKKLM